MKQIAIALCCVTVLSACASPVPFEDPAPAPSAAEATEQFPGTDVAGIANCVRENATEGQLALMALGGTQAQMATAEVLGQPETQACLAENNIALPGVQG